MDLSKYTRLIAPNTRIIESSMLMHTCKECLKNQGRDDLNVYIQSIKKTGKTIYIKTGRPIVNTEISQYQKALQEVFQSGKNSVQIRLI